MINSLLLLSGNDIPFREAQLVIHQPTLKEIAYIGQEVFFSGCQYLNFSKQKMNEEDKNHLDDFSNFEILMTMIKENDNPVIRKYKTSMQLVLLLLFPQYKIDFLPMSIMISKRNEQDQIERHLIDQSNFEKFQSIIKQVFCLKKITDDAAEKYNPGGPQAKALVQKFKKRQKKLAELKSQGKKQSSMSIFSQYISILAVGEKKDINQLLQYTIYQLFDEFYRFRLKQNFDIYVQAKMAGANNLEESENWMSDIHSSDTFKEDNFI